MAARLSAISSMASSVPVETVLMLHCSLTRTRWWRSSLKLAMSSSSSDETVTSVSVQVTVAGSPLGVSVAVTGRA